MKTILKRGKHRNLEIGERLTIVNRLHALGYTGVYRLIYTALLHRRNDVEPYHNQESEERAMVRHRATNQFDSEEGDILERLLKIHPYLMHLTACPQEELDYVLKNYHKLRELLTLNDSLKREELRFDAAIAYEAEVAQQSEKDDVRWEAIERITANSSGI